jgi:type I restriction enzyme S subunit
MEEWKEFKISDIIDEISMGPFGSNIKVDNFINAGIPVLNGSNLQGFKLNEDSFNYVSKEKADSLGKANAHRGDVVITHRGTLGQIIYIPEDSKYEQYVISQSQFRLKLKENLIRPDFFVYFFHTRLGQHRILMNASQVGVPALARPTSTFKEVLVPVPSMDVQIKVMKILHSLDDKIEVNRQINDNLEQQAQALFKSWFVDFEPFRDGGFVESELGMIPKGWRVGTFLDNIYVMPGGTPSTSKNEYWEDGTIPFFSPKDVNGVYCFETEKSVTELGLKNCSSHLYPKDTLFITARGTVGKLTLAGVPMAMNQSNYALVAKEGISKFYLFLLAQTLVSVLLKKANGAVFSAITTRDFNEPTIIPKTSDMEQFDKLVSPIFYKIHQTSCESRRLATLRDTLLPKLMSGELKVFDKPNDQS